MNLDDYLKVIRADLREMTAYPVQHASGMVKLDAMENPYRLPPWLRTEISDVIEEAEINRYPDPEAPALKISLRKLMEVPDCCDLILGNGSDEIISMLANAVAGPEAVIMSISPTFVMFKVSTLVARARYVGVSVDPDFSLNAGRFVDAMAQHRPAVVFIAYPNNPTGNLFDENAIELIIKAAPGLVVIDEAYHVFAKRSFMSRLPEFPNLMVMRTLSKLGLAGLRLGYAAARPEWLREVDKVRGPYNVGVLTQLVASKILSHHQVLEEQASEIILERGRVERSLHLMRGVKVFPSDANFLLLKVADAQRIYDGMKRRGVLVRTLHGSHPLLDNCLRFTIGTRSENDLLLDAFGKCIDAHE